MTLRSLFLALAFLVVGAVAPAQAATYTGEDVSLGLLKVGDSGTIQNTGSDFESYINKVSGSLAANTKITFTYTLTGLTDSTLLVDFVNYNYKDGGSTYTGTAYANSDGKSIAYGYVDGAKSTPLVAAEAGLTSADGTTGYTIIKNLSADLASFKTTITGILLSSGLITATFKVEAIPLPAALPLFGLGLAGLAGVRARRKAKQA